MLGNLFNKLGGSRRRSRSRKNRKSRRRRSYRGGSGSGMAGVKPDITSNTAMTTRR